jgi:hypothetical protein
VNTSFWRRHHGYVPSLFDQLEGTPWEDLLRFMCSEERQAAARVELRAALKEVGIPLRTGFFNPPFPTVPSKTRDARLDTAESTAPRFRHGLLDPLLLAPTPDALYPEFERV